MRRGGSPGYEFLISDFLLSTILGSISPILSIVLWIGLDTSSFKTCLSVLSGSAVLCSLPNVEVMGGREADKAFSKGTEMIK